MNMSSVCPGPGRCRGDGGGEQLAESGSEEADEDHEERGLRVRTDSLPV